MRNKLIIIGLLFSLSLPFVSVEARERSGKITGSTILVGSELDYPPYALVDENGKAEGFSVDLIKAVAREVGLKLEFLVGPWAEVKAKLETGEIDVLPLVAYSAEREKFFDFSRPHIISHAVAFIRKGNRGIQSLDDLRGKEVIVMRSDSAHEYVIFSNITDKIILTETVGDSFKLLSSGKHDFVIAPKLSGLLLLRDLEIENIEPFGEPLEAYGKGYSFAVHEGDAELLAQLDRGLVLVKASGEFDLIYDKWFGHVDPKAGGNEELIKNILISVGIMLLFILVIFVWNLSLRRQVARKAKELLQSETSLTATFSEAAVGLAHVALDGSWLRVNQYLCDMLGYSEDELLRLTHQDITCPDDLEKGLNFSEQILAGEIDECTMEKRYVHKDGNIIWINLSASLVRKENGEPDYFVTAIEDLTERKQLYALLIREHRQAQNYLDIASVMLLALDSQGNVALINRKGMEILGYEEDELLRKNWFTSCLPEKMVAEARNMFDHLIKGDDKSERYYENLVLTKSGDERLIAFHNTPIEDEDGKITGILSSGEDITERRQIENHLKKLSQAIEQAGEGVVITGKDGTIEYANPAFCSITGYDEAEVIGENPRILKSGNQNESYYEQMWATLTAGKVWQNRVIDKRKDGSLYPALLTISPIKDAEGRITHYVGVQQNLKNYEDLEKQFHQSQKMEAIGTLIGGIAHDFNNTLAGITSNLYLARQESTENEVIARVKNAETLSFSAAATIQQLLAFSRKGAVNMSVISIGPFLKEVIKLHRVSIPENIELNLVIADSGLRVKGDINQLQQVVMNLINNARDAVETVANPVIKISLSIEQVEPEDPGYIPELKNRALVCIAVEDNGCGISEKNREHIFEPFFTTKEQGKGTGLGLSMAYGAVKMHEGWIFVLPSKNSTGTIMKIYLPPVQPDDHESRIKRDDRIVKGQGETILLADDNKMVLDVGRKVLEDLNYSVITAEDGFEAVKTYLEKSSEIDLLLFDVVMPRLGGMDAFKQIRHVNPDVKIIFATGYNRTTEMSDDKECLAEHIVSKPFTIPELSQVIRQKLDT